MNDSEQSSENYRPSDSSRIEWFTTDWPDLLILLCHQPEMIFRILVPDFTLSNKFGAPLAGVEQPLEREALHWNYQLWEYASFHCGSGDVMIHKHTLTFSCLPRKPHKLSMNGIKSGWPWNWMPATRHWWRISFFWWLQASKHECGHFVGNSVCIDLNDAISEEETMASIALAMRDTTFKRAFPPRQSCQHYFRARKILCQSSICTL